MKRTIYRNKPALLSLLCLAVPILSVSLPVRGGPLPQAVTGSSPEQRLAELGITLPTPDKPVANYVKAVTTGNLVFLAGHGPCGQLRPEETGKVGKELTVEQGYAAARRTAICLIASLKAEVGELSRVKRIVKLLGMVNSAEGFGDQPKVVNGASDLLVEVFGERGKHARAAVGMAALPSNLAVEIEMIVEVE